MTRLKTIPSGAFRIDFKRFFTYIAVFAIVLSIVFGTGTCFAGQDDEKVTAAELTELLVPELSDEDAYGLRGFTVSPDGKRMFLGYLHGPSGDASHISLYNAETLEKTGEFVPAVDETIPVSTGNYYPKGLAVDNRGFLFIGVTHADTPYCSIYCVDNYMREIGHIVEDLEEITGINGIATRKDGDRILLYVLTCYHADTIRCYDVTDPTDMKLWDGFGSGGVVDYYDLTESEKDPGYIAVDVDGYVYITCLLGNGSQRKGSHVLKLSPDGKTIVDQVKINEAYGICTAGDYLFVSTYNSENSSVYVLNRSDLSEVAKYKEANQTDPLTSIAFANDRLYVADQGTESYADAGRVLSTKEKLVITRDKAETEKVDPGKYEVPPTEAPTEAPDPGEDNKGGGAVLSGAVIAILCISAVIVIAAAAATAIILVKRKKNK